MNFESLLSEYGKETGMMGDYAFGAHFLLEQVRVLYQNALLIPAKFHPWKSYFYTDARKK